MQWLNINQDTNLEALCTRPIQDSLKLEQTVISVFEAVSANGDTALREFTAQFDKVHIQELAVTPDEMEHALSITSHELLAAMDVAKKNIRKFHGSQLEESKKVETTKGVICWRKNIPIEKVGLYIPGGQAPLFSTLLMLAIPAMIAGCKEIILCTPPNTNSQIHPSILAAASLCGIKKVYKVGGIQAIAAMSLGTSTIPKVYKIFGPGNQYVTAAKQYAQRLGMAIDMPAGPSEVLVLADETANPIFVAADLLAQAEHGEDSQVILVSLSSNLATQVKVALEKQLTVLPRKEIAAKALEKSKVILTDDARLALRFVNEYAPEHLILSCKDPDFFIDGLYNAGSVFVGNYTPESAGDYASGTNHTLPTNGHARAYAGVSLDSFLKKVTFQQISPEGLQLLGPSIEVMADAEGLWAHKNAVSVRLAKLNE